nr:M23 family metallopeptidase [Zoogloeaceae bacterium]
MALVILSASSVTRGETRTISMRAFASLALAGMILVLACGVAVGMAMRPGAVSEPPHEQVLADQATSDPAVEVAELPVAVPAGLAERVESPDDFVEPAAADTSDSRLLIDRFGELAGRMIRLESEARVLSERISAIGEFEQRVAASDDKASGTKGRLARTPPGGPAGGPLHAPRAEAGDVSLPFAPDLGSEDDLYEHMARMDEGVSALAVRLAALDQIATSFKLVHMSFPGRSPMPGVAANSNFGNRIDPFNRRRAFHSGVDFNAPRGTPIHASAGGRVIYSGRRSQYGLTVEIEHMAGLVTRYAHASKLHVKVGEVVMPGALIAEVGSTGRSTGPHLHFEILKDGYFVNPAAYLARF